MKTVKIKKIQVDRGGGCYAIIFDTKREIEKGDFDLEQLGKDICFISSLQDQVVVSGEVTLKAGDSITDEFGGDPILGSVRTDAVKTDMGAAYRPTADYRDGFAQSKDGKERF